MYGIVWRCKLKLAFTVTTSCAAVVKAKLCRCRLRGWSRHSPRPAASASEPRALTRSAEAPGPPGLRVPRALSALQTVWEGLGLLPRGLARGPRGPGEDALRFPFCSCKRIADQATLVEQVKRVKEIEAIESDSFVQQTFRSSKEVKKSVEAGEVKHTAAASGPAPVAADPPSSEKDVDASSIPTAIKYQDDNSLAHPNLFIEKADAEEKWFKRLIALRQERLMGSPVA
ncbi:serine/Arginine-related protein 53-like [Canis lupus familiaris]|uniref:serine/Arginine-related protein 53-like n=1 Tax=Canis lupus familiaris TaxID=9615 RepID=UPI0018F5DC03|nr:serine/Arginine-related protein 53-like [Canis lupus familiaris]